MIYENIHRNVTSLADEYPDVDFYYFFPPCSAVWWSWRISQGEFSKQIEAEQYIIELILEHENIHLYSFSNRTDITTDLNNYKDSTHYGEWVNSLMLQWMYNGKYLLTKDNYQDIDNEWHQYVIDLTKVDGDITIIFNGGYIDNTGSADSTYVFGDITLY